MRLSKWISDAGSAAEVFSRTQDGRCDWHVHEPQGCARSMARSSSFISGVPDGDAQSYANASTKSMDSYKSGLDDQDALRGQAKGKMGHAAKGKLGAKAKMRRTEGYWAVPNEKCLKHRSFWRELFGPSVGPEHYCVNQNPVTDLKSSNDITPVQKCYDFNNCSGGGERASRSIPRIVQPTDSDYPNTVIFLTPEANQEALGLK
ncbi:unnamed protein product [Effrenium voratum]|nr:unnamed protein product [Effrenium voratum]